MCETKAITPPAEGRLGRTWLDFLIIFYSFIDISKTKCDWWVVCRTMWCTTGVLCYSETLALLNASTCSNNGSFSLFTLCSVDCLALCSCVLVCDRACCKPNELHTCFNTQRCKVSRTLTCCKIQLDMTAGESKNVNFSPKNDRQKLLFWDRNNSTAISFVCTIVCC